ncbi:amidohydrolase, partial [bacterium]|nr:amidohydrolase [bacterium]
MKTLGMGSGAIALGTLGSSTAEAALMTEGQSPEADRLYEEIVEFPIDDTHCHPLTDKDAQTTPQRFLERLSLAAFPTRSYFPSGVYRKWQDGDAATKRELDRQYGIEAKLQEIAYHFGESVFVKYMVKEMAQFLDCTPDLKTVIEARNERGRDYWRYVNDLFRDVKVENAMLDTGYSEGMDAAGIGRFEAAIAPSQPRRIYRVETIQRQLFSEDISFDELESRFVQMVRTGLDKAGNYGKNSYGMKSYLMPGIGLVKPLYDAAPAQRSWEELKTKRDTEVADREERSLQGRDLRRHLLTLALEECLERDMPIQFHAGDGEAPFIILRNQDPYFLEEVVRFDKDGVMRMPKIIPIHAGYPLVGKAAWLSHLYTNCYFELSIMTPLVHQGLFYRYMQVMEA